MSFGIVLVHIETVRKNEASHRNNHGQVLLHRDRGRGDSRELEEGDCEKGRVRGEQVGADA